MTLGALRMTDAPPVPDEQLVPLKPSLGRKDLLQIGFDFIGVASRAQPQPTRESQNVGIDGKRSVAIEVHRDHPGSFRPDSGQLGQLGATSGYAATVTFDEGFAEVDEALRLVSKQPNRLNEWLNLRWRRGGIVGGSLESREQGRGHRVHSAICGLR